MTANDLLVVTNRQLPLRSRGRPRRCADGFEIACDNAERVCVVFALDCCDREAMSHVAATAGIKAYPRSDGHSRRAALRPSQPVAGTIK